MKKQFSRFTAVLVALLLAALSFGECLPVFAAEASEEGALLDPTLVDKKTLDAAEEDAAGEKTEEAAGKDVFATEVFGENEGYSIIPVHWGKSGITAVATSTDVKMYENYKHATQSWHVVPYGEYYYLQEMKDNRVISVKDSVPKNSGTIELQNFNGSDSQLWKLQPFGDGTYGILSKKNERFGLDVDGFGTSNGAKVHLYEYKYQRNQRFRFANVTTVEDMSDWGARYSDCESNDWDVWDGSYDNSWYYGHENDPVYYIDSARAFAGLAKLVNDNVSDFEKKVIVLTGDINLAGIEWTEIGSDSNPFEGSFNGNGHAITGLSITDTESEVGLFGAAANGVITNLRVKGHVSGDWNTGGVVGNMQSGHLVNVYSEVSITRSMDDNLGGICGRLGGLAYLEHCTQNAPVTSGDRDPDRGGIAGYCCGMIRYCVNKSTVECDWDYVGGIAGMCSGGMIEHCANYGRIFGGENTQWAGGIAGALENNGLIFGCYNEGDVESNGDDDIGGILGERKSDGGDVYCSINMGTIKGRNRVGGVVGYGGSRYCFNGGMVSGSSNVGSLCGQAGWGAWGRGLSWTSEKLDGDGDNNGAEWIAGTAVVSGQLCYDLNGRDQGVDTSANSNYGEVYNKTVFYQNLGGDAIPTFSGQKVYSRNGSYTNDSYEVRVSYPKDYGTVTGSGTYSSGQVTLTAQPADGCLFDHYEVRQAKVVSTEMYNGKHNYPATEVKTYKDPVLVLTDNIKASYDVKAVFSVYDETPDDLKQMVKIELECVTDVDGWNSDTVPVYLVDSAGDKHLWSVSKDSIDGEGSKVSHTFDLGAASPVAVEVWPNFGGGVTFRSLGLKVRMWVNNAGTAIETGEVTIRSWPFISSRRGDDYMSFTFNNVGVSTVGTLKEDGSIDSGIQYTSCTEAWDAAKKLGDNAVIKLESAWLTDSSLFLDSGKITLDLNGYPIIRTMKKTKKDGEVIQVNGGTELHIIDSKPGRKSCSAFSGGSIQGGRSTNGAGLIHVYGTLKMDGGTLYNGGTTDLGGAIKVKDGRVQLNGTLIANCWSNGATFSENRGGAMAILEQSQVLLTGCTIRGCSANEEGGAIYMDVPNANMDWSVIGLMTMDGTLDSSATLLKKFEESKDGFLLINNSTISGCTTSDEEGGAVHQDNGTIAVFNSSIRGCRAKSDDAGGIYQDDGVLFCKNVLFESNEADDEGGAICKNTDKYTWLVNCAFKGNRANDEGGAIMQRDEMLYLEDCTLTGNAAAGEGGAVYVEDGSGIDLAGKIILRNNDGEDSFDNLVLEDGAYLYDKGLMKDSEVHVVSSDSGETYLTNDDHSRYKISETQQKYFVADKGTLALREAEQRDNQLQASAFSDSYYIILAGTAVIVMAIIAGIVTVLNKRQKGK